MPIRFGIGNPVNPEHGSKLLTSTHHPPDLTMYLLIKAKGKKLSIHFTSVDAQTEKKVIDLMGQPAVVELLELLISEIKVG